MSRTITFRKIESKAAPGAVIMPRSENRPMEAGVASSTVRTFTDPDAYHAAIRHTHAEGIVTGRGQFRAELTLVRLNRVSLHRSEEALPRLTYSAVDPALFLVAFPVHRDQQLYLGGLEMAHGDIFASAPARRRTIGWRPVADGAPSS